MQNLKNAAIIATVAIIVSFVVSGCATLDHLSTPPGYAGEGERMQRQAARIMARREAAAAPAKEEAPKPPTIAEQVAKLEAENTGLRATVAEQTSANAKLVAEKATLTKERDAARRERDMARRERDTNERAYEAALQDLEKVRQLVPGRFLERSRLFGRDVLIYEAPPEKK